MSILMNECKLNREHNHFVPAYADGMELRLRITAVREHAKLGKSELAKACGVDPSAINHLESGKSKAPSALLLLRLAKATKTRPEWIIEEDGEMLDSAVPAVVCQPYDVVLTHLAGLPENLELSIRKNIESEYYKALYEAEADGSMAKQSRRQSGPKDRRSA